MASIVALPEIALKTLPAGCPYAGWTWIGAAGTARRGIYLFDEPGV